MERRINGQKFKQSKAGPSGTAENIHKLCILQTTVDDVVNLPLLHVHSSLANTGTSEISSVCLHLGSSQIDRGRFVRRFYEELPLSVS